MQQPFGVDTLKTPSVVADTRFETYLEATHCLVCAYPDASIIHTFGSFKVVTCRRCGLAFLNPRLKESVVNALYQEREYFSDRKGVGYDDYVLQERSLRITFRKFLNELRARNMTSGKLLEVGCGYGFFLDEARNYFDYRLGIELSEEAGLHAKNISGAEIHIGRLETLPTCYDGFSVIVLINVIEHIYAPIHFLNTLKERLTDEGRIVISTPDIGSFWHKIMRKRWPSFKVPEHVAFYTRDTLKRLLHEAGFVDIEQLPFPHAFPLGLVGKKLGISFPQICRHLSIWLPKVMVALAARRVNG